MRYLFICCFLVELGGTRSSLQIYQVTTTATTHCYSFILWYYDFISFVEVYTHLLPSKYINFLQCYTSVAYSWTQELMV